MLQKRQLSKVSLERAVTAGIAVITQKGRKSKLVNPEEEKLDEVISSLLHVGTLGVSPLVGGIGSPPQLRKAPGWGC